MAARTAGRKGRAWRRARQTRSAKPDGDICCWCRHPGARDMNHDLGLAEARRLGLANDWRHLSPIHGATSGCPICPPRWSPKAKRFVLRNCNGEVGSRPLAVALAQRAELTQQGGSRAW